MLPKQIVYIFVSYFNWKWNLLKTQNSVLKIFDLKNI